MQRDGNFLGAIHYMVVGENVTFGRNDDTRSKSFLGSFLRYIESLIKVVAEELAEERIDALRAFHAPLASPLSKMKC